MNDLEKEIDGQLTKWWSNHRPLIIAGFAAVILLLLAINAFAGSVSLTWTAPTQRTDGSALVVAKYNLYRATSAAGLATATPIAITAPATSYTDATAPGGTTQFYAMTALDAAGIESVQTNPVSAVVPVAKPNPPSGVTVGAIVAYDVVKQANKYVLLAVGSVPNGVSCDMTQGVNGLNVVPTAAVTWFGTVRPPVVVAQCG